MAVTTQESTQYANGNTTVPAVMNDTADQHGRVRVAYFTHTQSGAGDATSSIALCKLPPGKVRILGKGSSAYVNWTTASATLDIGYDAHTNVDGTAVAASVNAIDDGVSVETAGFVAFGSALTAQGGSLLLNSQEGVVIRASSTDTAIVDTDTIAGYILYVAD